MRRIAVKMSMAVRCTVLDSIKNRFQVVERSVELMQVGFKVRETSMVVRDIVQMVGQVGQLASVVDQVAIFRRMAIVANFADQSLGFPFDT